MIGAISLKLTPELHVTPTLYSYNKRAEVYDNAQYMISILVNKKKTCTFFSITTIFKIFIISSPTSHFSRRVFLGCWTRNLVCPLVSAAA